MFGVFLDLVNFVCVLYIFEFFLSLFRGLYRVLIIGYRFLSFSWIFCVCSSFR